MEDETWEGCFQRWALSWDCGMSGGRRVAHKGPVCRHQSDGPTEPASAAETVSRCPRWFHLIIPLCAVEAHFTPAKMHGICRWSFPSTAEWAVQWLSPGSSHRIQSSEWHLGSNSKHKVILYKVSGKGCGIVLEPASLCLSFFSLFKN
jgi:hypothetical protein